MKLTFQNGSLLFFIFMLSVAVRWPLLNRPLSKHHEFCTATALRVISAMQENGMQQIRYKPATNFGRTQDKFINNYASASGKIRDAQGNYYYTSHPPFAYYLPYVVFKVLGIKADVIPLQILHLLINALSALFIFLIVATLFPKNDTFHFSATMAFAIYLFNPATLWFQSNVYMSDMLVQLPFVAAIWVCVHILMKEHELIKPVFLLFLLCFTMVYTSWLGIFFCVAAVLLIFRGKFLLSLALLEVLITALILGLGIAFLQYAKIAGLNSLKEELAHRFSERSSFHGIVDFLHMLFTIIKNYFYNYAVFYLMLFVGIFWAIWHKISLKTGAVLKNILAISIIPILLLHLLLSNYSGHDFTVLYAAVPLSIFSAFLIEKIYLTLQKKYLTLIVFGLLILNVVQFYYINRPGKIALNGERYDVFLEEGKIIRENATPDEVVFAKGFKPSPQTIWYAHKNIQNISDENEAIIFLRSVKQNKGIIFEKENLSLHFKKINLQELEALP